MQNGGSSLGSDGGNSIFGQAGGGRNQGYLMGQEINESQLYVFSDDEPIRLVAMMTLIVLVGPKPSS